MTVMEYMNAHREDMEPCECVILPDGSVEEPQPSHIKKLEEISGEDKSILNIIGANPHESPDRTKYRRINQREELWMLADTEYHDPSCWREIARENGILNPRKVDYTRRLKIPAL